MNPPDLMDISNIHIQQWGWDNYQGHFPFPYRTNGDLTLEGWLSGVPYRFHFKSMLDIGCGESRVAQYLHVRKSVQIDNYYGIDRNKASLENFSRGRDERGLFPTSRIRLLFQDYPNIPLPPKSIQFICAYHSLHWDSTERATAALREIYKLADPNGYLCLWPGLSKDQFTKEQIEALLPFDPEYGLVVKDYLTPYWTVTNKRFRAINGRMQDPWRLKHISKVLKKHKVEYLWVGGQAEMVWGGTRNSLDSDIIYRPTPDNITKAFKALRELRAGPRDRLGGIPLRITSQAITEKKNLSLDTTGGHLDFMTDMNEYTEDGKPLWLGDYKSLYRTSEVHEFQGEQYRTISLDKMLELKEVLNRSKDRASIDEMKRLRELRHERRINLLSVADDPRRP